MIVRTSILNAEGEKLDVLKWQNSNSNKVLVFVHGFGSNKHGNFELFDHVAEHFKKEYSIVQFDFAGYGKSEGKQGSCNLLKMAQDLEKILIYSRSIGGDIYLFAHAMGCFVASYLCPGGIRKAVFSNPVIASKESFQRFSILTPTYIIHAYEDEVVQNLLSDFDSICSALTGMSGDHNFTRPEDRIRLMRATNVFFKY